ncbi:MAG TPA: aminotransferase class III-fold pyridoxal phosphate-dependent enzyme [Thermoanaerobaculia bacterium]
MTTTAERYARHVDPAFVKLLGVLGYGRTFTRASGSWIEDESGRRYLDLLAGFGSVNIGHNHPRLLAHLCAFFDAEPLNLNHTGISAHPAMLAEQLARTAPPLDAALFSNGGAEAVETAMKLARAATNRTRILYCEGAYHGLTLGTLSVSATKRMRAPFEPLLPGCTAIPFDDLGALERALDGDTAAFLVEPIQIEGGVRFPRDGYLRAARELCAKRGALFLLDEVQTGLGRTGAMYAFQHEGLTPDVLILAKSAGGSIAPIGITLTTRRLQRKAFGSMRTFDLHGSTFAGNAFACAAAGETLRILDDEQLVARSRDHGTEWLTALRLRLDGHPLVAGVRGRGLLLAVELRAPGVAGQWLALALLERGLIVQPASQAWHVLRLEPPLTISRDELAHATDVIADVFDANRSLAPMLARTGFRAAAQFLNRGRFR